MSSRRRSAPIHRSLLSAALVTTLPLSLALHAGKACAAPPNGPSERGVSDVLQQAQGYLNAKKPVLARAVLVRAALGTAAMSDDDRTRGAAMLDQANERINSCDPRDVSLQKAELALQDGDVRTADRHVQAVLGADPASFKARADELAGEVQRKRDELSPIVPETLAQAERDFLAGRYAEAKSGLTLVDRSGVKLTPEQQGTLDRYSLAIVDLSAREPGLFGAPAAAGMMQPGVVHRRDDPPSGQPAVQPVNQPTTEPAPAQPAPSGVQPGDTVSQPAGDPVRAARVQEATDLLAQADRAFIEKRYNDAAQRYDRLRVGYRDVLTSEQASLVETRLSQSNAFLNQDRTGPQTEVLKDREIAKQQVKAEFDNDIDQAQRSITSGNIQEARNHLAQAQLRASSSRNVFSEAEYEQMLARVSTLRANVDKEEVRQTEVRDRERDKRVQDMTNAASKSASAEKAKKIDELIIRARAFQAEKRYKEAAQTVEELLFLDPINPTGLLLRDVYADVQIYVHADDLYKQKMKKRADLDIENQESAVPPEHLMEFPSDWPAMSTLRGEPLQMAEPAENRALMAELNERKIPSAVFTDNSLEDAIKFITTVSQKNVDVDWASLEEAGIRKETTVSLNLQNVSMKKLLDRLVEKVSGSDRNSKADWAVVDGVVTVASDTKLRKNKVLVIYDIKDLLIEVPDFRDAPRIDLQQALQASQRGGGGGQSPFRDTGNDQQTQQQQRAKQDRLNEIQNIITTTVDPEGWVSGGGDTGTVQLLANQGSLIIINTTKNHREIQGLLRKLRENRAMQINVECRFLLVNQDFFEQIGFDLDVYINAKNNQVRAAQAINPGVQASDFFNFTGQAPGLNRNFPSTFGSTTGGTGTTPPSVATVNPTGWSPIGFGSNSLGTAQSIAPKSANWGDTLLSGAPALGVAGQFLDDVQVDFLIKATQADRRSVQLTAPRLTFTNGQVSNIYVATQTAFVSDLQPIVGDSAVGFQPTVGVVTEGVTLLVEGTITSDRRFVTMTVDGGVSRVNGFANQAVTAIAGGQLVNSASTQSFIQLPQTTVTRVRTTVTVPDQGTLLLGGQRLVTEYEVETGVPVLSKIPILNRFFTNRIESKEEQTLMVLMKPTIIIQNEEEARNFPGLQQSLGLGN